MQMEANLKEKKKNLNSLNMDVIVNKVLRLCFFMFCYFCVKQQHSDLCNYFVSGKHKIKGFQRVISV